MHSVTTGLNVNWSVFPDSFLQACKVMSEELAPIEGTNWMLWT